MSDAQAAATLEAPTDLWTEDGEVLWLRNDLAETRERAKLIAFVGHDPARRVVLPETFLGGDRYGYDHIDAGDLLHLRPGEPDEEGWSGRGEDCWHLCASDHPKAVAYWPVSAS